MPPRRTAVEMLDPRAAGDVDPSNPSADDTPAPKRIKRAHEYFLSPDLRNADKRERRRVQQMEALERGFEKTVPPEAAAEMEAMVAEARAASADWIAFRETRPSILEIVSYEFERRQLPPLTALPSSFTPRVAAFFVDVYCRPGASLEPHIASGAMQTPGTARPGTISFYARELKKTVAEHLQLSERLVAEHSQSESREVAVQVELRRLPPQALYTRWYFGEAGTIEGPDGRQCQDLRTARRAAQSDKSGGSVILNMLAITEDTDWRVFEIPDLRIEPVGDEANLPPTIRVRRSNTATLYERLGIALLGPTTFNQAIGGKENGDWDVPKALLELRDKVLAACPLSTADVPISSAFAAKMSKLKASIEDAQRLAEQLPRRDTGTLLSKKALGIAVLNATALKPNVHGQVTSYHILKDPTMLSTSRYLVYRSQDLTFWTLPLGNMQAELLGLLDISCRWITPRRDEESEENVRETTEEARRLHGIRTHWDGIKLPGSMSRD